jgi:hypothetical protein
MLWLALNNNSVSHQITYALVFLFFSHFLWPFWMTLTAIIVETRPLFKKVLIGLGIMGFFYGTFLYVPLFFQENWLSVTILNQSIRYQIQVLSSGVISPYVGIFLYVVVSLLGLFLSINKWLNYLGLMLLAAFIVTEFFFDYAFISVWCFFAALISLYLMYFFSTEKFTPQINLEQN